MQELIDRGALLTELKTAKEGSMVAVRHIQEHEVYTAESIALTTFSIVEDVINNAPTIDPVKHGVWVGEVDGYADGYMIYDQWYCDQCNHCEENDEPDTLPNYCPSCGAKMSVSKNSDE